MSNAPFFILASPRSGTTLLERLLNRHPRLFVPPETAFFHLLRQRGVLSRPFSPQLARGFIDFYQTTRPARLLGLDTDASLAEDLTHGAGNWAEVFQRLLQRLGRDTGKPRLGEKTPHHVRCLDYLLQALPQARFIGLVRDGRAVVRSRMAHPHWVKNWYHAAMTWRDDVHAWRVHAHGPHAGRMHLVRYERLLADPETELRNICAFLGESYEPAMLDETQQPGMEKFSAYYRQPWMAKSTTGIDPSRAMDWVADYGARELALVEHLLRTELEALGYAPMTAAGTSWHGLYFQERLRYLLHRVRRRLGGRPAQVEWSETPR